MLGRIRKALRPGGYLICQFQWNTGGGFSPRVEFLRKIFALLTLGNLSYEKGDMIWANVEFVHAFFTEGELRSEFEAGDFEIIHIDTPSEIREGGAVLKKSS